MTLHIGLVGCCGKMGQAVARIAALEPGKVDVIAGSDHGPAKGKLSFPYFDTARPVFEAASVVVDFSSAAAAPELLLLAQETQTPLLIATTGHDKPLSSMLDSPPKTALLAARNTSLAVNLLSRHMALFFQAFGQACDISILEKHHKQKKDAPSGTALMFRETLIAHHADPETISVASLRAAEVPGEHVVSFHTPYEIISFGHNALNRDVFAHGALAAAQWLATQPPGWYTMEDYISSLIIP